MKKYGKKEPEEKKTNKKNRRERIEKGSKWLGSDEKKFHRSIVLLTIWRLVLQILYKGRSTSYEQSKRIRDILVGCKYTIAWEKALMSAVFRTFGKVSSDQLKRLICRKLSNERHQLHGITLISGRPLSERAGWVYASRTEGGKPLSLSLSLFFLFRLILDGFCAVSSARIDIVFTPRLLTQLVLRKIIPR